MLPEISIQKNYFLENFEHAKMYMFCDNLQELFMPFCRFACRAQVTPSSGPHLELAFLLGKTCVGPMKVMTFPELELQAALMAARLQQDIC